MANVLSDVVTLLDSLDQSQRYVDPSILRGNLRVAGATFDTAALAAGVGDEISLVDLPNGARVWAILIAHDAASSGAGVAGMDIGDSGDADRFVTAFNMDAAATLTFVPLRTEDANLADKTLGIGYKYASATRLLGTVTGEAFAADTRGHVVVVYSVE